MSPPTRPPPGWRVVAAVAVAAGVVLTILSLRHPGLRLVDFLGFSARGHRLLSGEDLVHPLYPVGYPLLVGLLQATPLSPMVAGRVVSIGAAMVAVAATTRWLGWAAGLWLLVQPVFLTYGASEGTDLAAFAAGLTALALRASNRPALAGVGLGLAALTRYTSVVLVPFVLWPPKSGDRPARSTAISLGAFVATTLPHWGTALVTGAPLLPDQSSNLAIGANAVVTGLDAGVLARLPQGVASALPFVFSGPGVGIGAAALAVAVLLGKRSGDTHRTDAALRLAGWGGLHLVLVATAFANARLVLPSRLTLALGVAVFLRDRPRVLAGLTLALGLWTLPAAWSVSTGEANLQAIVGVLESLEGPLRTGHFLTTDPWVHRRSGDHLQTGTPMREAGGDPRTLDAARIAAFARARGDTLVVLDVGRVQRTYPGLAPLLSQAEVAASAGLHPVGRSPGYRVFAVQEPE